MAKASDFDKETFRLMTSYAGRDLLERRQITEDAFNEYVEVEWAIEKFQDAIAAAIAAIPAECRGNARVELYGGYDESNGLRIRYRRTETDAEVEARVVRAYEYAKGCQEKERAEFERLKAKFGAI